MAREIREKFILAADRINELLSNISYVDKLSQLIRGGSRVPRSKRADKRTFAADESRQILAPWNTIDRLQPLRLIAFEP